MARAQAASTQHVSDNDTTCMRRCRQCEAMRHNAGTASKARLRGRQGRTSTRRGGSVLLVPATQQGRYAAHHRHITSRCVASVPWNNEPKSSPARAWQHRERPGPGVRERAIAMCCHVVAMCCCHVAPCLCNALAM
jgi:hypothetical protein